MRGSATRCRQSRAKQTVGGYVGHRPTRPRRVAAAGTDSRRPSIADGIGHVAVEDWRQSGPPGRAAVPFPLPGRRHILTLPDESRAHRDRAKDPTNAGRMIMVYRRTFEVLALATVLMVTVGGAQAEDKQYPSWKGEWTTVIPRLPGQQLRFDPSKPFGAGQEAPLTEEYKKIYQENLAEMALGGQGLFLDHASCFPAGMPTMMSAGTHEYVITPETTYIVAGTDLRRIFTDGRPWPKDLEPTYQGFSIGQWSDEDGDGAYDVLEVETRGPFK